MFYLWIQTMQLELFQQIHLIPSFAGMLFLLINFSQVAHSSIYGLMCGYTNFVCGHFAMRNGMVPIPEMMDRRNKYQLRPEDEDWQRLLATTGQPNFINRADIQM
jgi:hypothetical protein